MPTQFAVATELGVTQTALVNTLLDNVELCRAWERGASERASARLSRERRPRR